MPQVYDNWDRLVRATLRREQLRLIAQRTPSDLSLASSSFSSSSSSSSSSFFSSSFNFSASSSRLRAFKLPTFLVGKAFDYDEILRASNYFTNSNLIMYGRSGDLFNGVLDNGTAVVIKKIDMSWVAKELEVELEFYAKVSHFRFVPLLGHCLDNPDYKFLVYKYMSNRDLATLFLQKFDADEYRWISLDWDTRLKIAIGVAEALCYLHHECSPPLVHRFVRASSILLDDKYEARLGSLCTVCAQVEEKQKENIQNRFIRFLRLSRSSSKGTSGSPNATCSYDVYCFGKVLLQLVTGKLGISAIDDVAMKQDWLDQKLACISMNDKKLVENIADPHLITNEDQLEEVWAIAVVARSCLTPKPSRRPQMRSVLKVLENPLRVAREENIDSALSKARRTPSEGLDAVFGNIGHSSSDVAVAAAATNEDYLSCQFGV